MHKRLTCAISPFYARIADGLYDYYMISITPEPFTLWLSIEYIAIIIIDSLGSISGSVLGSVFIVTLNEIVSHATELLMNRGASIEVGITIAPLREFVYGLAIILFIISEPKGLAPYW